MKETIRLSILGLSVATIMAIGMHISSASQTDPSVLDPEEISWVEFCRHNGYDPHTQNDTVINEFLDTWRGSALEEEALARHGAQA